MTSQPAATTTPGRGDHGNMLTVSVSAPRDPDPRQFTFKKNTIVGEAAQLVAEAFGYSGGGTPTFQNVDGEILDRNKTLAAEHVRDGDELELVDIGGGV
jgi:hypothetical protein